MADDPSVRQEANESKSSVAIKQTAKGDFQHEVKAYEGVTQEIMSQLATIAETTMNQLLNGRG